MTEHLDVADYLLIAEALLGVPAETIARWPGIGRRVGAAGAGYGLRRRRVLPRRDRQGRGALRALARNHPLPDGNKRLAYLAMVEFLARNQVEWTPPSVEETVATIEGVAAGRVTERELADWLRTSRAES